MIWTNFKYEENTNNVISMLMSSQLMTKSENIKSNSLSPGREAVTMLGKIIRTSIKIRMTKAMVFPILIYDCESWMD